MFDIFWKRKPLTQYPAYLGHTVYQSEYDALKALHKTTLEQLEANYEKLREIRVYLEPFATVGAHSGGEDESTVQLAMNAYDMLKASSVTMKQQAREIEQLTEQLDVLNARLEQELTWKDELAESVRKLTGELDALRQQQIMLTTTTPNKARSKAKPKAVIE